MRHAAATGSYSSPDTLIHTVLNGIGPARTLNLSINFPDPLPLLISSIAIALSSVPPYTVSSHDATQAALRLRAEPDGLVLPPTPSSHLSAVGPTFTSQLPPSNKLLRSSPPSATY